MTKTMEEIMANFTSDEQAEIQAEADKLIVEEMKRQEQSKGRVKISHIDYKTFEIKNHCLIVLPDNFFSENSDNYLYSSETLSFITKNRKTSVNVFRKSGN